MSKQDYHRDFLTRDSLWTAIRQNIAEQNNSSESNPRQISQKERVLNVLFNPIMWSNEDIENTLKSQVESFVNKDSNLYAYTFFLCSNPQFKYNWSYLLHKIDPIDEDGTYAHTLLNFRKFVDLMIGDINYFLEKIRSRSSSLTFMINRFIKIKLGEENGYEVEIELGELSKGFRTVSGNGYILMVYLNSTLLGVFNRKKKDNVNNQSEILSAIERTIEKGIIK